MLISPAYAQASGGGAGGFDIITLLPLVLIFVVFYFLLIRPQQKRVKEHKAMIEAVRRGDTIVTNGGVIGKVTKVKDDQTIQVEIAEGVRINVVRGMIAEVRNKSEPATDSGTSPRDSASQSGGEGEKRGLLSRLKK